LAGLGSILFAISFDRAELNGTKPVAGFKLLSRRPAQPADYSCPVASSSTNSPKCMSMHSCWLRVGRVVHSFQKLNFYCYRTIDILKSCILWNLCFF